MAAQVLKNVIDRLVGAKVTLVEPTTALCFFIE
jgi:hypothetical protein